MPGSFPGTRGQHTGIEVIPGAVRQARRDAGLSQAQVAEPQFSRSAVYKVEAGTGRPSKRLLRQIAHRTRRPLSYFLAQTPTSPEQRAATNQLHRLVATADFAAAIAVGERLVAQELPVDVEAEVRFLVGRAYVRSLDGQRAQPHLVRARELYEMGSDQAQLADVLNQLACALYLVDDSRCLSMAYQALESCERLRPPQAELIVRTLIVLGMIYYRLQDWNRALTCYQRALEETGTELGIRNLAFIHEHLGLTLQRVQRYAEALRHARKAWRLHRSSLDPTDLFRAELYLGVVLLRQGDLRAARTHLERALVLCQERELQRQARCMALLALAELDISSDEFDAAHDRLTEALRLAQELGERIHEATAWRLRGRLHVQRKEFAEADRAFAEAVRLFAELKLPVDVFDAQAEHSATLWAQGRTEEAWKLSRDAIASSQVVFRRLQGGWADLVAANWGS